MSKPLARFREHRVTPYLARLWRSKARAARHAYRRHVRRLRDPEYAIMHVFGPVYGPGAVRVANCESRLHTYATNGQYLGLFQMGSSERRLYGHGSTVLAQARAAHRYFVSSGRDWSPWSCGWAA